jgi:chemotaxis protein methyltransferase CheR
MFKVTIDETRNITRIVYQKFGVDLSGMAMTSLRLKISQFCNEYPFQLPENLISWLLDEPGLPDLFISRILHAYPDIFRDPDLWISLREQILPGMIKDSDHPGILIPDCVSGDEIYSMAILLKECKLDKQIRLSATCLNKHMKDQIREGFISKGRFKYCQDNYRIFHPDSSLDKYFELQNDSYYHRPDLFEEAEISVNPPEHPVITKDIKLILFRNRTLYLDLETSRKRIQDMVDQASNGTILILGIRESLQNLGLQDLVHVLSSDLSIYTKAG